MSYVIRSLAAQKLDGFKPSSLRVPILRRAKADGLSRDE